MSLGGQPGVTRDQFGDLISIAASTTQYRGHRNLILSLFRKQPNDDFQIRKSQQ